VGREKEKESAMGVRKRRWVLYRYGFMPNRSIQYRGVDVFSVFVFGDLKMNPAVQNLVVSLVAMQRLLSLVFRATN